MSAGGSTLDLLLDVDVDVTVELGRRRMPIREILTLGVGAVLDLRHPVDVPVDLLVNGRVIAGGEIVAVDESFGVRLTALGPHAAPSAQDQGVHER